VTSPSEHTPLAARRHARAEAVSPAPLARIVPRVRPYAGRSRVRRLPRDRGGVGLAFPLVVRYLLDAAFQQRDRALLDRIAVG
jgi:subfamily B ATP-binding cassette protein MsbA